MSLKPGMLTHRYHLVKRRTVEATSNKAVADVCVCARWHSRTPSKKILQRSKLCITNPASDPPCLVWQRPAPVATSKMKPQTTSSRQHLRCLNSHSAA
eukprot:3945510-Amphidinium_carterae.1